MLTFKIAAIIIIAAAGIFGGWITLRSSFNSAHTANLNMGDAFAGGVFLGAGFLHMLPDGLDNFSVHCNSRNYSRALITKYPKNIKTNDDFYGICPYGNHSDMDLNP